MSSLWLDANNLSGEIPAELARLSSLEGLNLSNNELVGTIPPELGGLANLGGFILSNNQLTGNIPAEFAHLSKLELLILSENSLTGSIPPELGQLSKLGSVYLSGNQLTGMIPPELGQLSNLSNLYLSQNQLSGSLPPELGELEHLLYLDLADNSSLSGPLPREFLNLSLVSLDLENTSLCVPSDAEYYAWLQEIPFSQSVASCESIISDRGVLLVMYNELNGQNWADSENWLADVPIGDWHGVEADADGRVSSITLVDNQLSGAIPSELGQLTNLETLNLSSNLLTGVCNKFCVTGNSLYLAHKEEVLWPEKENPQVRSTVFWMSSWKTGWTPRTCSAKTACSSA